MKALEKAALLGHSKTSRFEHKEREALEFMSEMAAKYVFTVSYSGGKDSSVCWHLANRVAPGTVGAHLDSGGEHPLSARFVVEFSEWLQAPLVIEHARLGYLDLLWLAYHGQIWISSETLMRFIIDEPAEAVAEAYGANAYVIGLRKDESKGRKMSGNVHGHEYLQGETGLTRIAPLLNWTTMDVWAYIVKHKLPIHPAYFELLDGESFLDARVSVVVDLASYHTTGTLSRLRKYHPAFYTYLKERVPKAPWPF